MESVDVLFLNCLSLNHTPTFYVNDLKKKIYDYAYKNMVALSFISWSKETL